MVSRLDGDPEPHRPIAYLVQQIEFWRGITTISRILDEKRDEFDEGVAHRVVLFSFRRALRGVDPFLGELLVYVLDAHLRGDPEEARDHVVGLEDAVHVHAMDVDVEVLRDLNLSERAEQHVPPLAQEVLRLLLQARGVVVVASLYRDQKLSIRASFTTSE